MLAFLMQLSAHAAEWAVLGPGGAPTGRVVDPTVHFRAPAAAPAATPIVTDPAVLLAAARDTLAWLDAHPDDPGTAVGMLGALGVDRDRVRRTLLRVIEIAEEDALAGRPSRLLDTTFIDQSFEQVAWWPDQEAAAARKVRLADGELRLTHYFVPRVTGRGTRDAEHPVALYADPGPAWHHLTRTDVFRGAFEPGGLAAGAARALVWLSEADAHDALLQGTIAVDLGDGATRLFNVDKPNQHAYLPGVAGPGQKRLWYFKEVDGMYGWAHEGTKLRVHPEVSVAGDPYNLGIGKLLLLTDPAGTSTRFAIVGDTGGAFQPNLFQLDWLAGVHADRVALAAATATLPGRVFATILLVREPDAAAPPHP